MNTTDAITASQTSPRPGGTGSGAAAPGPAKPFVSVVVPAFNEAAIAETNLAVPCRYLEGHEGQGGRHVALHGGRPYLERPVAPADVERVGQSFSVRHGRGQSVDPDRHGPGLRCEIPADARPSVHGHGDQPGDHLQSHAAP